MKQLKRLSSTVKDDYACDAGTVLAHGTESVLTWRDFLANVTCWQHRIASIAEAHIAIHVSALDEFLACLWACWRLGKIPVLSSSAFRDAGALFGHAPATTGQTDLDDIVTGIHILEGRESRRQSDELPALLLFTSGSSGNPQIVAKHFSQLDAELSALEQNWGHLVDGTMFVSMVSHHHMYGLPFGLLWPLVRGSAFYKTKIQYPESIERIARQHALTLVASPVQLDNLHAGLDWDLLGSQVKNVFSAGAPLSATTAEYCQRHFGRAVTEIYGSTETGAVAWRFQLEQALWQCLPGVEVSCPHDGGQLQIASPAIDDAGSRQLEVADTGIVHGDGCFELLGRIDRIVKVGGKRISLAALDAALEKHPWIKAVRTVMLEKKKNRLGAVVVLTARGNEHLVDAGKSAVSRALKAHIERDFDRISLPRYWRFVTGLPVNTEGKCTRHALAELFADNTNVTLPKLLANEPIVNARHHRLTFVVPEDLHYFSGHFPGSPVLPGVVQIAWAIHFGKELFGDFGCFSHLEAVKFQSVILPNVLICLELNWSPETGRLLFTYSSSLARHSTGRILFKLP